MTTGCSTFFPSISNPAKKDPDPWILCPISTGNYSLFLEQQIWLHTFRAFGPSSSTLFPTTSRKKPYLQRPDVFAFIYMCSDHTELKKLIDAYNTCYDQELVEHWTGPTLLPTLKPPMRWPFLNILPFLYHLIVGVGFPLAWHLNLTVLLAGTACGFNSILSGWAHVGAKAEEEDKNTVGWGVGSISHTKENDNLCIPSSAPAGKQQAGETMKSSRRTRYILPPDLQTDLWSLGAELEEEWANTTAQWHIHLIEQKKKK